MFIEGSQWVKSPKKQSKGLQAMHPTKKTHVPQCASIS